MKQINLNLTIQIVLAVYLLGCSRGKPLQNSVDTENPVTHLSPMTGEKCTKSPTVKVERVSPVPTGASLEIPVGTTVFWKVTILSGCVGSYLVQIKGGDSSSIYFSSGSSSTLLSQQYMISRLSSKEEFSIQSEWGSTTAFSETFSVVSEAGMNAKLNCGIQVNPGFAESRGDSMGVLLEPAPEFVITVAPVATASTDCADFQFSSGIFVRGRTLTGQSVSVQMVDATTGVASSHAVSVVPSVFGVTQVDVLISNADRSVTKVLTAFIELRKKAPLPPSVSLTADATQISYGEQTMLRWNSSHALSCKFRFTSTEGSGLSGSISSGVLRQPTTFVMDCLGADGQIATASIKIELKPITMINAVDVDSNGWAKFNNLYDFQFDLSWRHVSGGFGASTTLGIWKFYIRRTDIRITDGTFVARNQLCADDEVIAGHLAGSNTEGLYCAKLLPGIKWHNQIELALYWDFGATAVCPQGMVHVGNIGQAQNKKIVCGTLGFE